MPHALTELLIVGLLSTVAASTCEILGSPELPLLSREGDVVIGGAFSIHSKVTQPPLSYREKPAPLSCSR